MSEKTLSILAVDRHQTLWEGQAEHVTVPAIDGRLGILPRRQPLLAVLEAGEIHINVPGGERVVIEVEAGVLSVDDDVVTVVLEEGRLVTSE